MSMVRNRAARPPAAKFVETVVERDGILMGRGLQVLHVTNDEVL